LRRKRAPGGWSEGETSVEVPVTPTWWAGHRADNDIIMEQSVSGVVMLAVGSRRGRRMCRCAWNRSVESGAVRVCAGCAGCVGGPREAGRGPVRVVRVIEWPGWSGQVRSRAGWKKKLCKWAYAGCAVRGEGHVNVEGAVAEVRTPSEADEKSRLDSTHGSAACLRACPPACLRACLRACLLPTRYSAAHREQPLSTPQSRVL
jgi:hypothetical protein